MNTCCWCTPGGPATVKLLKSYAASTLSPKEVSAANDDLSYCLECVDEYHKAREEVPSLLEVLWDCETTRLINHFEKSMRAEDEDDLYLVEEDRVTLLSSCCTGPEFEKRLRVPLLEVLKYPYLLLSERLSELCVEALCKMEEMNYSYQVVGKHPGIYLLMVHPNEMIRRWAILTARNLGKVDRDDYYDIQEVMTSLFKVIELGLFENPDIYRSSMAERTRLILLPSHLYDVTNYKNYWLGLCMLLSVLEEQAMDSLLLGPDRQNFMQSIMNTMKKATDGDSNDPFWPMLHCFMVILDKLGSKVWGQLVDPMQAFDTIINNASYKKEIESIRQSCKRTKSEPLSDYEDVTITCSQIVYNYNSEKPHKDSRQKTTVCLDYCPTLYEDMQTLTDMFQCDIGQDMRLHNSTFLWFIPFVHSLMDLKDLGVAFSIMVIQHLYSEVKEALDEAIQPRDKVSEFFIWILLTIVELSLKKKCFNALCASSEIWVEVVVKCASLPSMAFKLGAEKSRNGPRDLAKAPFWEPDSVQSACMNLIRIFLKEGCQVGRTASPFLDELNLLRRSHGNWKLSPQQARELQACLTKIVRDLWSRSLKASSCGERPQSSSSPPNDRQDERSSLPPPQDHREEQKGAVCKEQTPPRNSEFVWADVKEEPKQNSTPEGKRLVDKCTGALKNGNAFPMLVEQSSCSSLKKSSFNQKEGVSDISKTEEKFRPFPVSCRNGGGATERSIILNRPSGKIRSSRADFTLKLKQFVENRKRGNVLKAGSEKQQVVEEKNHVQGGAKSGMAPGSSGTSTLMNCKPEGSSEGGVRVEVSSVGKSPSDNLAGLSSAVEVEEDSEESSTDDELNIPFRELLKRKCGAPANLVTEPEVDKDLKKLSLAAYPESKLSCQNPIQRKVQGSLRSLSGRETSEANQASNSVIIISDTSSDEEENKVNLGRKIKEDSSHKHLEEELPAQGQELVTTSGSPLACGEYESQCFEFETNEEIYSAWEGSQLEKKSEAEVSPGRKNGSAMSCDLKIAMQLNDWGYDSDYLGDDIEQAEEVLEPQGNMGRKPPVQDEDDGISKENATVGSKYFADIHPGGVASSRQNRTAVSNPSSVSSSSSAAKGSNLGLRKSLAESKWINTAKGSPKKKTVKAEEMSAHKALSRSDRPFVVPPQKVHHFPEPTSTVEKLGLKKRARRAAELSQRTQESLAKLRSYGKTAGELPQKRKAKLIEPRRMVVRSKKLLASQDRQFFRQSRPERREGAGGPPVERAKAQASKLYVQPAIKMELESKKEKIHIRGSSSPVKKSLQRQCSRGEGGLHSPPSSPERKAVPQDSVGSELDGQGSAALMRSSPPLLSEGNRTNSHTPGGSSSSLCGRSVALRESSPALTEKVDMGDEDDFLFLTQRDPVDMDLCSQVEGEGSPENMGADFPSNSLQSQSPNIENGRHPGIPVTANEVGPSCQSPPVPGSPEHNFAKPFAPTKPSTKKIFSSSASSRLAHLSKELESSTNPLAAKNKLSPARLPAAPAEGMRPKLSLAHILRSQNLNFDPWLGSLQKSNVGDDTPSPGSRQQAPSSLAPATSTYTQHRDHSIFIKYILKWSYDMFANSRALGPPNHLLQAIVSPVPIRFQNYDDYFNIFFPLMILNAFEEVAQEWLENQKFKEQKPHCLNLLNFNVDLNKADFTANISERDLDNQHHPKDDDLVFLIVSNRRSYYDEQEGQNHISHHVGFVTRFSHPSIRDTKRKEQQVTCHLSIQTQGNLSRIDKQVKCIVVSSLATTHRRFRALLMLNRSPLATPILCPSTSYFSPRDLNKDAEKPISYMKEFNENQRRAIETAYAMITQQPSLSKICLIHGPPGTGKSKVIVGLLQRILGERSGKENPVQRPNAKIKRNRVLVCAPSNAAVDHLMKKIIAEFKNNNNKTVSGNCGNINLVRLGQQKSINSRVRKFSLNDQIDHKMNKALLDKDQSLQKKKEDLDRQLDALSLLRARDRNEKGEKKQRLEDEICHLSKERQRLAFQLKEARGRSQELKASIILESHVICCTLSTSGGVLLESAFRRLGGDPVSCVIIDEAGQTCEVDTLIPLIHGCKKLVLVGDPKQLPPTVKSLKALDYKYDQSLMSRLCTHLQEQDPEGSLGKLPILQLTTQYRMHPEICLFPSKYIYQGVLTTARKIAEDRFSLAWPFQPYLLFDVLDGREERESDSYSNLQEVKLVTELIKIMKGKKNEIGSHQIGIITPYSAQKRRIQKQLVKEFGESSVGEVDTVDGFQGREKDCIIVTCVRANSTQGSLGFLKSLQRLNVTITRAKYSLFILGKLKTLMENKDWNELIQDAQRRGNIVQTSKSSYRSSAMKILKSRPCPPSEVMVPEREAQEGPGRRGGKPQEPVPIREAKHTPVTTAAPVPRSSGSRPFSAPQEPAPSRPPPPAHERPQDPRLARRAELGLKAKDCKESQTSSSGPASAQSHFELCMKRSYSSSDSRPDARLETSGGSAPMRPLQGTPLEGRVSCSPSHVPGASATTEPAKARGRLDRNGVSEWDREQDYRSWCRKDQNIHRRTSEALPQRQGSVDPKRRRTTF